MCVCVRERLRERVCGREDILRAIVMIQIFLVETISVFGTILSMYNVRGTNNKTRGSTDFFKLPCFNLTLEIYYNSLFVPLFFKGCHRVGMDLKYISIISHISTYKSCVGIITNRAVHNFNVLRVLLHLAFI